MAQWVGAGFGHENYIGAQAKTGFGPMMDTALAEPMLIDKHGRGVVVVVSVEEYERFSVQSGRTEKTETGTKVASWDLRRSSPRRRGVIPGREFLPIPINGSSPKGGGPKR